MDGVKVALGNSGKTVEAAQQCAKGDPIQFHVPIFAWQCGLSDCPPILWCLSP